MDCQWCQPRANKDEGNKSTGFEEISLEVFIQADVSVFDHKTNRIKERERIIVVRKYDNSRKLGWNYLLNDGEWLRDNWFILKKG